MRTKQMLESERLRHRLVIWKAHKKLKQLSKLKQERERTNNPIDEDLYEALTDLYLTFIAYSRRELGLPR